MSKILVIDDEVQIRSLLARMLGLEGYEVCPVSYTHLSHSEIFGSKVICTYPKLIVAYHVLHRLREPRHPLCALAYFLSN